MRARFFVSVVTAGGLLGALQAAPVRATVPGYVCESFQHKFEKEVELPANGFPIQCTVAAKVHVDPKDSCQSTICVSLHEFNLFSIVGPPLEVEVVSTCIDDGLDGIDGTGLPEVGGAAGPGGPPGETSVCLAGAGLGATVVTAPEGPNGPLFGEAEGKIKIKCDDGIAKTKGDLEYRCSSAPE